MRLPSSRSFVLASFAAVALSSAACSIKIGDKTEGEKGAMSFAYSGPSCFFGCGLDRSALQGAQVSLTAKGGDPNVAQTARVAESSIARVSSQRQSCSCDSGSGGSHDSRSVEPSAQCRSGETKSCSLSVDLETMSAGDARLEVVDLHGTVIDSVVVHVRPAARIDISVNGKAFADGDVTTARVGDKLGLEAIPFDANGDRSLFTEHGISHDYGDTKIVGPDDSVLIGSTNTEDMVAIQPGDTTVNVHAPGTERLVRFHVVR
jgi:hypothetical protein